MLSAAGVQRAEAGPTTCIQITSEVMCKCVGLYSAVLPFVEVYCTAVRCLQLAIKERKRVSLPQPGTSDVAIRGDSKICAAACCDRRQAHVTCDL